MFEFFAGICLISLMILLALYYEMICEIGVMYFITEVIALVLISIMFNYKKIQKKYQEFKCKQDKYVITRKSR